VADGSESSFVTVDGDRIYRRVFGARRRGPTLLCLHGGPGATHDYLRPLADLTARGYRVAFYDALGCGRSDLPEGRERFTLAHDLTVLDAVRRSLGGRRIHLMGSSYGGLLALAYATRHSDELASLVSTGGLCDVPFASREMARLVRALPIATRRALRYYGARGEYQHPAYEAAAMTFYHRHVCRLRPWPRELEFSLLRMSRPVYETMNGPNEFTIVGNLRSIDFTRELGRIAVPTLLVHGRYDEVTPAVGARIQRAIPGARLAIFPKSSHVSFWEERPTYRALVGGFLKEADGRGPASGASSP